METAALLDFTLPATNGKSISPQDYPEAKVIVVVFTCNHCPYAIAYEHRLVSLANEWATAGVQFLAISSNDAVRYPQDSFENMKVRAIEKQFPFPYLYDESQTVAHAFGAERTPEVFVFSSSAGSMELVYQGAIDDNYQSPQNVSKHYLNDVLKSLSDGNLPQQASIPAVGCSIKWKQA